MIDRPQLPHQVEVGVVQLEYAAMFEMKAHCSLKEPKLKEVIVTSSGTTNFTGGTDCDYSPQPGGCSLPRFLVFLQACLHFCIPSDLSCDTGKSHVGPLF
jgi:hypothetical protein